MGSLNQRIDRLNDDIKLGKSNETFISTRLNDIIASSLKMYDCRYFHVQDESYQIYTLLLSCFFCHIPPQNTLRTLWWQAIKLQHKLWPTLKSALECQRYDQGCSMELIGSKPCTKTALLEPCLKGWEESWWLYSNIHMFNLYCHLRAIVWWNG